MPCLKENWEKKRSQNLAVTFWVHESMDGQIPSFVAQDLTSICRFVDGCRSFVYCI